MHFRLHAITHRSVDTLMLPDHGEATKLFADDGGEKMLAIAFHFEGVDQATRQDFMRYFDLYTQRGGG